MSSLPFDYANLSNLTLIEHLYTEYLQDPARVDPSWQRFFEGMALGSALKDIPQKAVEIAAGSGEEDVRIFQLIEAYRAYGHRAAKINPVAQKQLAPNEVPELRLDNFSLGQNDLERSFPTCGFLPEKRAPLSALLNALERVYCGCVGFEYWWLPHPALHNWLQAQIEPQFQVALAKEEKKHLFELLNKAEFFEAFLQLKYPGQKRFSVEGGETLIPLMHTMIDEGAQHGVEEIILGMAHRGRLNILANVFDKPYSDFFREFEPHYYPKFKGSGDVKYHKGYIRQIQAANGKTIEIALCDNPSHLESVDPVVVGRVRAKQELKKSAEAPKKIVPVLIHGDAAIAGQGVVYETLQMFQLPGYRVGGTIHIVVNNQVGFTAVARESKSAFYCTDVAQAFGSPVFHVNAEDPESCVAIAKLALRVRQEFGIDVFIELNCYRKYGHNEADEPSFTQPVLYRLVREKTSICSLYRKRLIQEGSLAEQELAAIETQFKEELEKHLSEVKQEKIDPDAKNQSRREPHTSALIVDLETAVPLEELTHLAEALCRLPEGFAVHPKVKRIIDSRRQAITGDPKAANLDWGLAETLAYATLLTRDQVHVRIAGQDSGRGTFSHRHAIVVDQQSGKRYYPLSHLSNDQSPFDVYNSLLSEYAALGFEYGYSLAYSKALVIWEAQFGDFSNGAQIMIDQYLTSGETKWDSQSALTLFLPHGYEGQGPEHSSARIERYLQLAAEDNISIIVPTTAAQMFHLLRRQALIKEPKPLIVCTPKALLRFPPALTSPEALATGKFQPVIDDPTAPQAAKRLLLCSGKVYYDLIEERDKRKLASDVAIVRIEQLYPLPKQALEAVFKRYQTIDSCFWVQEEVQNMGAWEHIHPQIKTLLPEKLDLRYVGRERSASPAAGSGALHKSELAAFLTKAFET
ncbi:MAG: 2-oxoglutarate dehydrogenase E1 component [Chlamydiota bacterium]